MGSRFRSYTRRFGTRNRSLLGYHSGCNDSIVHPAFVGFFGIVADFQFDKIVLKTNGAQETFNLDNMVWSGAPCGGTCDSSAHPNINTGAGFQYFEPACVTPFIPGAGCVEQTGCRLCTTKSSSIYPKCPVCVFDLFGLNPATGEPYPAVIECEMSCNFLAHPNIHTGAGFLVSNNHCDWASSRPVGCVENTGCQLCTTKFTAGSIYPACPACIFTEYNLDSYGNPR